MLNKTRGWLGDLANLITVIPFLGWIGSAVILAILTPTYLDPILALPLGLKIALGISAFFVVLAVVRALVRLARKILSASNQSDEWKEARKTPIIGKTYRNQRVELDGYSYTNCTFINVTFVYRGEKPFDLSHNAIHGSYNIDAPSGPLQAFLMLLRELNYLNPEAQIYDDSQNEDEGKEKTS